MQPGVEPVWVTQTAQVNPGLEKRILHGIGSVLVIAQDEPGGPEEPIGRADRQWRERIEISPLRPDHEVSLHRSTFGVLRPSGRSVQPGAGSSRFVPSSRVAG
jgi:hypothetical protein